MAAVTVHHNWVAYSSGNLFAHSLAGQKSEIKVSAEPWLPAKALGEDLSFSCSFWWLLA